MTATPRQLPQIQTLLALPTIAGLLHTYDPAEVTDALRQAIDDIRQQMVAGRHLTLPDFSHRHFAEHLAKVIRTARQPNLRSVVNATGVIIHTNLGRAPLAPQAVDAMRMAAESATNLEFDLTNGKRGSRHDHVENLICTLTGSEAAIVVNNCAAAVLLSLTATAAGRGVIASRGELIEIGGSFRLPDVVAQSGAILKEVGATNKTRITDYADAIDDNTAVLLKSHTSNYRIVGFTAAPTRQELAALARDCNLILMEDLGSGILIDLAPYGLGDEPVVNDILKTGVDVVMFSGDKLLGGPQCGIVAGKRAVIDRLRKHPMARAVRIDKLSLAALEATLRLYQPPHDPIRDVPVLRMLSAPIDDIRKRADALAAMLTAESVKGVCVMKSAAHVGGGALPQHELSSHAVAVAEGHRTINDMMARLRQAPRPVIARVHKDSILFDMRTVCDGDLPAIAHAVQHATAP